MKNIFNLAIVMCAACLQCISYAAIANGIEVKPTSEESREYSAKTANPFPEVWWRQINTAMTYGPDNLTDMAVTKECADNTASCDEVYLVFEVPINKKRMKQADRVRHLVSFFSGKKTRIIRYEQDNNNYRHVNLKLVDASKLSLVLVGALPDAIQEAEVAATDEQLSRLPRSKSPIRLRSLWGNVDVNQYLDCVPKLHGLEAIDSADRVLWRRMIVAHGAQVQTGSSEDRVSGNALDPYSPSCFSENQFFWDAASIASPPLRDGTVILVFRNLMAMRIHLDGKPSPAPENVRVYDFDEVLNFERLLYKQRQNIRHWVFNEDTAGPQIVEIYGRKGFDGSQFANPLSSANFLILQYYLFPELLQNSSSGNLGQTK